MRIRSDKLKLYAEAAGLTDQDLAQAIDRTGLEYRPQRSEVGAKNPALSAVRNWMRGTDQPRAKRADIERLAQRLGVRVPDLARFECRIVFHRGSPRKAKLLADLIRGRNLEDAENLLTFNQKRAAVNVKKALLAAMAEAGEVGADVGQLVVHESRVDGASHIKRFQPKDRGRAHPILKRQSHITVSLVEGRAKAKRSGKGTRVGRSGV